MSNSNLDTDLETDEKSEDLSEEAPLESTSEANIPIDGDPSDNEHVNLDTNERSANDDV